MNDENIKPANKQTPPRSLSLSLTLFWSLSSFLLHLKFIFRAFQRFQSCSRLFPLRSAASSYLFLDVSSNVVVTCQLGRNVSWMCCRGVVVIDPVFKKKHLFFQNVTSSVLLMWQACHISLCSSVSLEVLQSKEKDKKVVWARQSSDSGSKTQNCFLGHSSMLKRNLSQLCTVLVVDVCVFMNILLLM